MTAMDKKIKELNEKFGRKTGVNAQGTMSLIGKEIYASKPTLTGVSTAGALFVFTTTGVIGSVLLGIGAGYAFKKYVSKGAK